MTRSSFDIANLFRSTFGIARGIEAYKKSLRQNRTEYDKEQVETGVGRSVEEYDELPTVDLAEDGFGNVRDTLNAKLPSGASVFLPVKIGDLLLPNEPTVFINRKKKIVSTPLVGAERNGTVKELIGFEDTEIVIRGIALNYANTKVYPEKIVKDINDLYNKRQALDIECGLTRLLGIYRVVIKTVKFPEMIGIQHAQAYELKCISDEDFILEI